MYKLVYSRTTKDGKNFHNRKAVITANSAEEARLTLVNTVNIYTECKRVTIKECKEV